jgi:hypothetical protein
MGDAEVPIMTRAGHQTAEGKRRLKGFEATASFQNVTIFKNTQRRQTILEGALAGLTQPNAINSINLDISHPPDLNWHRSLCTREGKLRPGVRHSLSCYSGEWLSGWSHWWRGSCAGSTQQGWVFESSIEQGFIVVFDAF